MKKTKRIKRRTRKNTKRRKYKMSGGAKHMLVLYMNENVDDITPIEIIISQDQFNDIMAAPTDDKRVALSNTILKNFLRKKDPAYDEEEDIDRVNDWMRDYGHLTKITRMLRKSDINRRDNIPGNEKSTIYAFVYSPIYSI